MMEKVSRSETLMADLYPLRMQMLGETPPARLVGRFAKLLETAFWMTPATRTATLGFCWWRTPRPRASGVHTASLLFACPPRSSCFLCAPLSGACTRDFNVHGKPPAGQECLSNHAVHSVVATRGGRKDGRSNPPKAFLEEHAQDIIREARNAC